MTTFTWIVLSGIAMSCIALAGSITTLLKETQLKKILLPLVSLSAGSLIGGAFFHMLPSSIATMKHDIVVFILVVVGFSLFLALEQFMHWHHCHREYAEHKEPTGYLILIADGLHNMVGGLAVGSAFIIDIRLGITTWLMAAAHEIPQELGDFGVLVQSGWNKRNAIIYNFLSGLTFLLGGVIAYLMSQAIQVDFLIPLAAGNFIYIGASDLIPIVNKAQNLKEGITNFLSFNLGLLLLLSLTLF